MIKKTEIEDIITNDLNEVLKNKTIYKYSNFETGLERIVLNKTLKFSHPSIFNDPFDCNEDLLKVDISAEVLDKTIDELDINLTPSRREQIKKLYNNPNTLSSMLKKHKDKFKISCFSKLNDEVLMWSHYADKHKGICIGFNFPYKYDDKFILCPVKYLDKMLPLDGETSTDRIFMYWLTAKSVRWRYEQEIRAITNSNSKETEEIIHYDKKFINEIIFGCNVGDREIKVAIEKIKTVDLNFKKIIFKRMIIDKETFLLKEKIINHLSLKID